MKLKINRSGEICLTKSPEREEAIGYKSRWNIDRTGLKIQISYGVSITEKNDKKKSKELV